MELEEPDFISELRACILRVQALASIDIDALIISGELIPKGRGWFAVKDKSVLDQVGRLATRWKFDKRGSLTRVKLESVEEYKNLAANLRPDA